MIETARRVHHENPEAEASPLGEVRHLLENLDAFIEMTYSREKSFALFTEIEREYQEWMEPSEWKSFRQRIELVFSDFFDGPDPRLPKPVTAFWIHQRERTSDIERGNAYDDATVAAVEAQTLLTYALEHASLEELTQYRKKVAALINSLPPFRASILSTGPGQDQKGAVVCVPIRVDDLSLSPETPEGASVQKELLQRVLVGMEFMKRLGVKYVGLGAVFPRITGMGELLRLWNELEGEQIEYTTGHAMTIALMMETLDVSAQKHGLDVSESTLAMVGCGYIGKSFMRAFYSTEKQVVPRRVLLHDVQQSQAEKLKKQLERVAQQRDLQIECIIVPPSRDTENDIRRIVEEADITVCATTSEQQTTLQPFQQKKTRIIIDDSQPTCIARHAPSETDDTHLHWVTAHAKNGYKRTHISFENDVLRHDQVSHFGAGGFVPLDITTLFGCELELRLLYEKEREAPGFFAKYAQKRATTPENAQWMRGFFHGQANLVSVDPKALQSYATLT